MGKIIPLFLVDNGSALNVCPLRTFKCLGLKESDLSPTSNTVRAYDNTRREVMGSIKLVIGASPINPVVEFQVIDIPACFNLLLGRHWLHSIKGVSSSLHQKLKFFTDGRVITILGDDDNTKNGGTNNPILAIQYVSNDMLLSGFRVEPLLLPTGDDFRERVCPEYDPHGNVNVIQMFRNMHFMPGLGLGQRQEGISEPIVLKKSFPPCGLGYQPSERELRMIRQAQPRRRLDCIQTIPGDSLNGRFIKEGEDFPFCGFPEPRYDHIDKKMKPGMEIFFQDSYPWAKSSQRHIQLLIKDTEDSEGSDSEDSFSLQTLGLTLCMVHSSTTSLDPSHLIKAADTPLLNWHAMPVLPVEIPLNPMFTPSLLLLSILALM